MRNSSFGLRALQVATSLALCTIAIASQANPYTLEGTCTVTSIVAGQGKCELTFSLTDDFTTPTPVRNALIKVNGIQVHRYMNDSANPNAYTSVFGRTNVACGANYTVSALISKVGSTTYETVGSLPTLACPPAP